MKTFQVEICRSVYQRKTFEVAAESEKAAEELARQEAYDFEWSSNEQTGCPDYEIEQIEEVQG